MPAVIDITEVMGGAGGEEAVEIRLRRFTEDVHYLQSLRQELLRKYLDQWIAVYEHSVAAHGRTVTQVRKQLSAKGIPENEAVIDFVASERKAMLL